MDDYRYILEPYHGMASRHHCPACNNHEKTFSRYIDCKTGKFIDPSVGRCNRDSKCGYHYTPKQYFQDNPSGNENNQLEKAIYNQKVIYSAPKPVPYISPDVFKASLKNYDSNNFVIFLFDLFGINVTNQLIAQYFIGTSKYWNGATVFWQIDISGKIRDGKIMLYNPELGKRIQTPFNHITWVHSALKMSDFTVNQCLFGEHLLKDSTKPIAVVESEKTAIIASVYFPQFIWVAVGGKQGLTKERCLVLKGRKVILFPDLGCFEKWSMKAKELSYLADFIVSDLLEKKATENEKTDGLDLADYLVTFDYKTFAEKSTTKNSSANSESSSHKIEVNDFSETEIKKLEETDVLADENSQASKYKTFGDIFDYYKSRGNKSLPKNLRISIPGWN